MNEKPQLAPQLKRRLVLMRSGTDNYDWNFTVMDERRVKDMADMGYVAVSEPQEVQFVRREDSEVVEDALRMLDEKAAKVRAAAEVELGHVAEQRAAWLQLEYKPGGDA